MIAEAVEGPAPRDAPDQRAILALIEKGAGLLPAPRCGEIAHAMLVDLDLVRNRAVQQLHRRLESFLESEWRVVASEYAVRPDDVDQRVYDRVSVALEPGAHELHDEPPIISVHHERWQQIAFAVHEAEGGGVVDCRASRDGACKRGVPPRIVDRCVRVAIEQAERDLGARAPERDAERLTALIGDTGQRRRLHRVVR